VEILKGPGTVIKGGFQIEPGKKGFWRIIHYGSVVQTILRSIT